MSVHAELSTDLLHCLQNLLHIAPISKLLLQVFVQDTLLGGPHHEDSSQDSALSLQVPSSLGLPYRVHHAKVHHARQTFATLYRVVEVLLRVQVDAVSFEEVPVLRYLSVQVLFYHSHKLHAAQFGSYRGEPGGLLSAQRSARSPDYLNDCAVVLPETARLHLCQVR